MVCLFKSPQLCNFLISKPSDQSDWSFQFRMAFATGDASIYYLPLLSISDTDHAENQVLDTTSAATEQPLTLIASTRPGLNECD